MEVISDQLLILFAIVVGFLGVLVLSSRAKQFLKSVSSINMDPSQWLRIAGLNGALAVAMGAFGAHGLRQRVTDERILAAFQTGSHYHLLHSAVLLICPFIAQPHANIAGALFMTGNLLFSGSLYALGVTENRKFGAITPIGGLAFIAGWITLALAKKRL